MGQSLWLTTKNIHYHIIVSFQLNNQGLKHLVTSGLVLVIKEMMFSALSVSLLVGWFVNTIT